MHNLTIAISACLSGQSCRYDGQTKKDDELLEILKEVNLLPVCPEVSGGLDIPRKPAEIIGESVINTAGTDVTENYLSGAHQELSRVLENGAAFVILKNKSPACGKDFIYDGSFSSKLVKGDGIFVRLLKENKILTFKEDEKDLIISKLKELSQKD